MVHKWLKVSEDGHNLLVSSPRLVESNSIWPLPRPVAEPCRFPERFHEFTPTGAWEGGELEWLDRCDASSDWPFQVGGMKPPKRCNFWHFGVMGAVVLMVARLIMVQGGVARLLDWWVPGFPVGDLDTLIVSLKCCDPVLADLYICQQPVASWSPFGWEEHAASS